MEAPSPARPDLPENLTATQSDPDSREDAGKGMAEETVNRDRAAGLGKGRWPGAGPYSTGGRHSTPTSAGGPSARGTKACHPHLGS